MRNLEKERLEIKSTKLFDTTPKSRSSFKKGKPWKALDIKEETVNFLRTVDYARLGGFDVEYLLTQEVVATSYCLRKDGDLRKSPKSEFARELKYLLEEPCPTNVPETSLKTAIVIDFMAYARKVPIKKMNLVGYEDLFGALIEGLHKHGHCFGSIPPAKYQTRLNKPKEQIRANRN